MKINDLKPFDIINNNILNSNFLSIDHNKLKLNCKIYKGDFYSDSYNYFPITKDEKTFLDLYSWGEKSKYNNFFQNEFYKKFQKKKRNFKVFQDITLLGSSAINNYYTNLIIFLPRIFFIPDTKINLGIHRHSSNNYRKFIKDILESLGKKIKKFVYLDDDFYNFKNSQIPQFFSNEKSIKILNQLPTNIPKNIDNKIYITRQDANYRNIINEQDLIGELKKNNFRIINTNNFSLHDQIKIFASAKIIVSPTGSSLANLVFCKKGTKVFEILPRYNLPSENNLKKRYSDICKILDLKYFFIEADSIESNNLNLNLSKFINPQILASSNYYKNLIVKKNDFNKIINKL